MIRHVASRKHLALDQFFLAAVLHENGSAALQYPCGFVRNLVGELNLNFCVSHLEILEIKVGKILEMHSLENMR